MRCHGRSIRRFAGEASIPGLLTIRRPFDEGRETTGLHPCRCLSVYAAVRDDRAGWCAVHPVPGCRSLGQHSESSSRNCGAGGRSFVQRPNLLNGAGSLAIVEGEFSLRGECFERCSEPVDPFLRVECGFGDRVAPSVKYGGREWELAATELAPVLVVGQPYAWWRQRLAGPTRPLPAAALVIDNVGYLAYGPNVPNVMFHIVNNTASGAARCCSLPTSRARFPACAQRHDKVPWPVRQAIRQVRRPA